MVNFATEGMLKLYTDADGFTTEDCYNYLEIVSGAPLGAPQRRTVNDQCEAITEYIGEADGGKSSITAGDDERG